MLYYQTADWFGDGYCPPRLTSTAAAKALAPRIDPTHVPLLQVISRIIEAQNGFRALDTDEYERSHEARWARPAGAVAGTIASTSSQASSASSATALRDH